MGRVKNPKYQHEPLYSPHGWDGEERRFVYNIESLFDDVYQKLGKLSERITALEPAEETEEDNG